MKAGQLAEMLGYEICGDPELRIHEIRYAEDASEQSLAIIRKKHDITETKGNILLCAPTMFRTQKTMIFSHEDIMVSAIRAASLLMDDGSLPDYSKPISQISLRNYVLCGERCEIDQSSIIYPCTSIGNNVKIGSGCVIESNVTIGSGVWIGNHVVIHAGARIGADCFYHFWNDGPESFAGTGMVQIGDYTEIGYNTVIQRGTFRDTVIGRKTQIGNVSDIGHDVHIGDNCKIVSQASIAGEAYIGDNVTILGQTGVSNGVRIGMGLP